MGLAWLAAVVPFLAPSTSSGTPPPPPDCSAFYGKLPEQLATQVAAMPALDWTSQYCLSMRFSELGPSAAPAIASMLGSDNRKLRDAAVYALDGLAAHGIDVSAFLPAMLRHYADPASASLQQPLGRIFLVLGKRAAPALPIMLAHARRLQRENGPWHDAMQTYFRLAEINGAAVESAIGVLDTPGIESPLQSEAARFLGQRGSAAAAAAPSLERLIARLQSVSDSNGGAALLDAYGLVTEPARSVPFVLERMVQAPGMANWGGAAIERVYRRDKSAGGELLRSMRDPAVASVVAPVLREMRRNDEAVKALFPDAARALVAHLAGPGTVLPAARALSVLDEAAPGAAAPLIARVLAPETSRADRAVYMRALGAAGGIPDSAAPALLELVLADLAKPAVLDDEGENPCSALRMLNGFATLPPSMVAPLTSAYFGGMHETNYDCPQQLLWVMRNADSVAAIDAQMRIFVSPRLYDVCSSSWALAPRRPWLAAHLLRYLPRMKGLRLPLLERAIASAGGGQGVAVLRPHVGAVLPRLMRELANPLSEALHAPDTVMNIGQLLSMSGSEVDATSWCGIPQTRVGLAIYRIDAMQIEHPAVVTKMVEAADNRDLATSSLAMRALYHVFERGTQMDALVGAVRSSSNQQLKALLGMQ